MDMILLGLRYLTSLVFGVVLSAAFSGVEPRRRAVACLAIFTVVEYCAQVCFYFYGGLDFASMAYPLATHIPLALVLVLLCKREPLVAAGAVLLAYMCCELPYMAEGLCRAWFEAGSPLDSIVYVITAAAVAVLVLRFAARHVASLLHSSRAVCLLFSSVPLIFYVWDYAAGVYSDWMVANSYEALIAVLGVFSLLFVVFAVVYGMVLQRRSAEEQERRWMALEVQQSKRELESLRLQGRQQAALRHDFRHKLVLIKQYADEGDLAALRDFASEELEELADVTPVAYCANQDANVLLSHYVQRAKHEGVDLKLVVSVPGDLGLSSSELCSLLGNALENALEACAELRRGDPAAALCVEASLVEYRGHLLLSVRNSCRPGVAFEDGLPCRRGSSHGLGAWSIRSVAERHGGQASFSCEDGSFLLRVAIPLT